MSARVATIALAAAMVACACAGGSADPDDARRVAASDALAFRYGKPAVTVIEPIDGARVTSPFVVKVGTENLRLSPSGRTRDGEGHLHVVVDRPCVRPGVVIPDDDRHVEVRDGSSEVSLDLPLGRHRLCVQIGDGFHVALAVVQVVTVDVVAPSQGGNRG